MFKGPAASPTREPSSRLGEIAPSQAPKRRAWRTASIHIDILTPKQVRLFKRLIQLLSKEHEVLVTARRYRETVELLELEGIGFVSVGEYGGEGLERKLEASLERSLELAGLISDLQPDATVSHASPEAARVAFGLGIPHICINDSPHAEAVARLTVPLCSRLLTPKIIPKGQWTRYGIDSDSIIQPRQVGSRCAGFIRG